MNTILWVLQSLLAGIFVMAGYGKISSSRQQHIKDGHIKPDGSVTPIRILGVLEWMGCIGIIVPWLTNIFPVLTPIAAGCFCLLTLAGMVVHIRKKEYKRLPLLAILGILSFMVAYSRFSQLHELNNPYGCHT